MSDNFNNSVLDWSGRLMGFKCFECGGVFDRMWGTVCNRCRREERLIQAVESLAQSARPGGPEEHT